MRSTPIRRLSMVALTATAVFLQGAVGSEAAAKESAIVVPRDYATIQAAIDAADPGGTVKVLKGTYTEQLTIAKDLNLIGAGMDKTFVRAPWPLAPNLSGRTSIIEIFGGADVDMSRLTVAGPGAGTCAEGPLGSGIRVLQEAHLDFSFGAVRDIHTSPMDRCSGSGFVVGDPGGPPASVSIRHSIVANYQSIGVLVLGEGSIGNVSDSIIRGPGAIVGTGGIELVAGAVGTITRNTIRDNVCPASDPTCGTDWFTEFQLAGILAGGNGPGTVITHNLLINNQIGLFLSESDVISHNRIIDSEFFGLGIVGSGDGNFTIDHGSIIGGGGGLWVVGLYADTTVVLNKVRFAGLAGPTIEVLVDDPSIPDDPYFSVTIIGGP